MNSTAKALYEFFSSFGIPAFVEYAVPDGLELPYITYQLVVPDWSDSGTFYARIWYRSNSYSGVISKADQISAAVGDGTCLPTETGAVYLFKGSPWAQNMPMAGDDTLKVVYLNFIIHAVTT